MSNLILPEDKKILFAEYLRRRIMIICSLSLVLVVVALVLLFSIGVVVEARLLATRNSAAGINLGDQAVIDEYQKAVKDTNQALAVFTARAGASPTAALNEVTKAITPAITLTGINFGHEGKDTTLVISGSASTRTSFLDFSEGLKRDPFFSSVDSPLSNLIKDTNSPFTLTLKLK